MIVKLSPFVLLVLVIVGCQSQSLSTAHMAAIPDYVVDAARSGVTRSPSTLDDTFETNYESLKAVMGKPGSKAPPPTESDEVMTLLKTDLVQGVVDEVHNVRTKGARSTDPLTVSDQEVKAFRESLTRSRKTLLADVSRGKGTTKKLDRILVAYFTAYANGEFIDRNGTDVAKPSVNGGVNNEAITGLVTVFWEALFDFWTDVPVLAEADPKETYSEANVKYVPASQPSTPEDAATTKLYNKFYTKSFEDIYLTDGNKIPTALKLKAARLERLVAQGKKGIDDLEAKAIKSGSNLAGKKASALAAGLFGFIGKINIGFVFMPGFSVGDDKTLMEIVKVTAEVATRRGTQAVLYKVCEDNNLRTPELDRVVNASSQLP